MAKERAPGYGHEDSSKRERRLRVAKKLSAALTLLLSAGATWAANSPADRGPQEAWHEAGVSVSATDKVDSTVGMHDVLPGAVPLPGVRLDASTTETYQKQLDGEWTGHQESYVESADDVHKIQQMVWARLFDKDPAARETVDAGSEVEAAADAVEALLEAGYEIDSITLHGNASDEDDTTWRTGEPGAGLGVDSDKNVRLAEERARAVEELFVETLRQKIGDNVDGLPTQVTGGTEMRDEALNQVLVELAAQRGESVQDMIVAYNRGNHDTFTADQLEVLDQLKDHRFVSIEVKAHKTVTETVWKHQEGEWVEVTEENDRGTIVIIPVLIPWVRRRRDDSESGSPAFFSTGVSGATLWSAGMTADARMTSSAQLSRSSAAAVAAAQMGPAARMSPAAREQHPAQMAPFARSSAAVRLGNLTLDGRLSSASLVSLESPVASDRAVVLERTVAPAAAVGPESLVPASPSTKKQRESTRQQPPRAIGETRDGHGSPMNRRIQPAWLNDNRGSSTRGHSRRHLK